jgi:hypothetical protein
MRTAIDNATYQLNFPQGADLQTAITTLLGGVALDPSSGTNQGAGGLCSLRRTLPVPHPLFQAHFCSGISSDPFITGTPPQSSFALYPSYDVKLQFSPCTYAVLPDSAIDTTTGTWYDFDGNTRQFQYANEWMRYTDFIEVPQGEFLTANQSGQGGMKFRATDGAPGAGVANGSTFVGQPRIYMPNSILKFTWFQVPYRYAISANSYLSKYRGYINQNPWYNWQAGELLYLNYCATRYTPPVQTTMVWNDPNSLFSQSGFSQAKMCDIELTFLVTKRTPTAAPTPANKNYIAAGHNCQPWMYNRNFYYATSVEAGVDPNDNTLGVPCFKSIPMEILLSDPDAITSNGGL